MKQSTPAKSLTRWALVLAVFSFGAALCLAQGNSTRAEVMELLNKHDEALNKHSLEGVLALFAPGPKTVVLGTGPGEKFQGTDEIKAAYIEIFKDFDQGTSKHECYWKNGGGNSTMVWGTAMCKFSDSKGDKRREYELNVSAVAQKQGSKWQFVMLHYSNLVSGK